MEQRVSNIKNKLGKAYAFLQANPDKKRLLIIFAILLTLPLTVAAALTVQNIRQKASGSEYVKIVDGDGRVLDKTTDPNAQLQITLPPDWVLPSSQSMQRESLDDITSLVKKAYAQSNGSTCLNIHVNNGSPVSPGKPYPAVVSIRNDGDTNWTWDNTNPYKLGSQDPQDNTKWSLGRVNLPTSPIVPGQTATFNFTVWPPETPGVHSFNWQMLQENIGWFGSRCYYNVTLVSSQTAVSPTAASTAVPTFPSSTPIPAEQPTGIPPTEPSPTQASIPSTTPNVHILQQIIIENKDDGSGGDPKETIPNATTTLLDALTKKIPWKLNDLKEGESQTERVVQVTLFDGVNYVELVTTILLIKPTSVSPTGGTKFTPLSRTAGSNQSVTTLTNELLSAIDQNNTAFTALSKDQQVTTMKTIAKQRYAKLLAEVESNPQQFIQNSTLVNKRDSFPKEIQQYIESNINETGRVNMHIAENLDNKGKTYYSLISNDKEYFIFSDKQVDISPGSTVSIRGIRVGKSVAVTNIQKGSFVQLSRFSDYPPVSGAIEIAVVQVKFADDPKKNASFFSHIEDFMISIMRPLNLYYQIISHEKLSIIPDMVGPITIDVPHDECGVGIAHGWADAADDELAKSANGFNRGQYFTVIYILPDDNNCFWAGLANVGRLSKKNRIFIAKKYKDIYVYVHELGHNLGLTHAAYVTCGNKSIGTYKECNFIEYGDVHDIMGKPIDFNYDNPTVSPLLHPNAPHQEALEILGENETIVIEPTNNPQTVKVTPLERAQAKTTIPFPSAPLIKILKEVKDSGGNYYYYIEYRRPIYYDSKLPEKMTQGISIHVWSGGLDFTELINPNIPRTSEVNESALADGESFYDHLTGLRIKQISHDSSGAVIEISKDSDNNTVDTLRNISGQKHAAAESNPQFKLFTQCFKEKANTASCPNKNAVDYNKDGKVDDQDYKLFLQSL